MGEFKAAFQTPWGNKGDTVLSIKSACALFSSASHYNVLVGEIFFTN